MSFTQEQVKHIANLSKLELKDSDVWNFQKDLDSIIWYVDLLWKVSDEELKTVKVSNFEILPLREDVFLDSKITTREELLACSSKKILNHSIAINNIMD